MKASNKVLQLGAEHVVLLQEDAGRCVLEETLCAGEGRVSRLQQGERPRHSLTPELALEEHLSEQHADSCPATRKLFPIFRQRAQRKVSDLGIIWPEHQWAGVTNSPCDPLWSSLGDD